MSDFRSGTVTTFDEAVGLGEVTEDAMAGAAATATYLFHCTQIADGSRTIAPGTRVTFRTVAAHGGRYEAVELRERPSA